MTDPVSSAATAAQDQARAMASGVRRSVRVYLVLRGADHALTLANSCSIKPSKTAGRRDHGVA
jgi:hypothetical protein